jgi:polyisoprenyl-phosphate glycosyltransferase
MTRKNSRLVSIIVPVYNEFSAINIFWEELDTAMSEIDQYFEVIFVDDGSNDNSLNAIRSIKDSRISVVSLSRNFGKEAALTAGLDCSVGDAVIPIDIDLQDPIELISQYIEKWNDGYDVVYGVRVNRESDTILKKSFSFLFYKIFNFLSDTSIPENTGDFRLMDRKVVLALRKIKEKNRFMKGIFSWVGFNSVGIDFEREKRSAGLSKWTYWKLWNYSIDAITGFSTIPLKIWLYFGLLILLGSFIYAIYIFISVFINGIDLPGYASLVVIMLFFGGLQLFVLGIYGEYIARIYLEVKSRPVYIVDSIFKNSKK